MSTVEVEEEAAPLEAPNFVLGRDSGGHWIVMETHGVCGGLFASKDAAMRFARFEGADSIRVSGEPLEFKI